MLKRLNHLTTLTLAILACGFGCKLRADVRLPHILGSHMVVQREKPIVVWGWADPSEKVTVQFAGLTTSTATGIDGRWTIRLPPQKANPSPQKLTVSGTNSIELTDVLIGEVWLCSGQSNMRWIMTKTEHGKTEIPKASYPRIRLFGIKERTAATPQDDLEHEWTACTPVSVAGFSAVAYHFGQNLHTELGVPIGLIRSAWGGTEIEPWIPQEGLEEVASLRRYADQIKSLTKASAVDQRTPSAIYNAMIHPLAPFSIRGIIWYQGESNCVKGDTAIYTTKTLALAHGWRRVFQQSDLPFYFVQIAPFPYSKRYKERTPSLDETSLPRFWEAQTACLKVVPNCGMVVITDITGDVNDIHPRNKRDVGHRLARWALAKNFGRDGLTYSGPIYKGMVARDGNVVLSFRHRGNGLKSLDGKELTHFEIAGTDKKFVPAKAVIKGDGVTVSSPRVPNPLAVRFAWGETAIANFGNSEGLPAAPFRTDKW